MMININTLGIWQDVMHGGDEMSLVQALSIALIGICVVLAELALIAVFIKILSAIILAFSKKKATEAAPAVSAPAVAAPAGTPLPASQSAGSLDLIDVDEPTAAVIMAIVSNESGIPLNRLAFKSIKLVEEGK